MKYDIAIIGLGTFGFELAVRLAQEGHGILAIDIDEKKINAIKDFVPVAVQADVTDKDVLEKLEINNFDKVIFGMSNALETIILSITIMKKMKVNYIIGKANTYIKKEILLKIGADKVVLPEISTAIRLAEKISHPTILERYELDKNNSLLEVEIPSKFIGKTLSELDLRRKHGINVVMKKDDTKTEVISNPNVEFKKGDIVFVIGSVNVIENLFTNGK